MNFLIVVTLGLTLDECGKPLALFVTGVGVASHVDFLSLALNIAVLADFLQSRFYLHDLNYIIIYL
jgi:hypothetical protein